MIKFVRGFIIEVFKARIYFNKFFPVRRGLRQTRERGVNGQRVKKAFIIAPCSNKEFYRWVFQNVIGSALTE